MKLLRTGIFVPVLAGAGTGLGLTGALLHYPHWCALSALAFGCAIMVLHTSRPEF